MKQFLLLLFILGSLFSQKQSYVLTAEERVIKPGQPAYFNPNVIWILEGDLIIQKGARLEIAPGTTIKFRPNTDVTKTGKEKNKAEIIVYGELDAQGEPSLNKFITFTSDAEPGKERSNDWYGIVIYKNSSGANTRIKNVNIQYAYRGISCIGSSPYILNNRILYSYNSGIYLSKSNAIIESNQIQSNGYAGVEIRFNSKPKILENNILDNDYGIMVYDSSEPSLGNDTNNKGANSISNNFKFDIYNASKRDIIAKNNSWTSTFTDSISKRIYDKKDQAQYGEVVFLPISEITSAELQRQNIQTIAPVVAAVSTNNASTRNNNSNNKPVEKKQTTKAITPKTQETAPKKQETVQPQVKKEVVKKADETPTLTKPAEAVTEAVEEETGPTLYEQSIAEPFLTFALDQGTGQVIQKAKPDYSGAVAQLNIKGRVFFRLVMDKDGNVLTAQILRSDNKLLEEPALEAAKKFKFTPGRIQGEVVRFTMNDFFSFR